MAEKPKSSDHYSDQEAQRRVEKALRAAFSTPHKTYEESKIGKPRSYSKSKRVKRRRGA
jgi:hypothetical protein